MNRPLSRRSGATCGQATWARSSRTTAPPTSPEFGLDSTFEAHVAASVAAAGVRGFPRSGEALWIVERGGRHAGSLALTDEGDGHRGGALVRARPVSARPRARAPDARRADRRGRAGYGGLALETFSDLRGAAHLYRSHGFELRWEQSGPRWGREQLTYQRYELSFQARAQSSSSESTGSSERPFSVSA